MFLFPMMYLPTNYDLPPTLYSIMNSIANFDKEDKTKIRDLPLATHEDIFDFEYPLSSNVSSETFEVLILKKFMMRRIGYDTMTAFKLALEVKLNEIMPMYNKMFDMLEGWDLFNDGEEESRNVIDGRNTSTTNATMGTNTNSTTSDRRYSELPQNRLTDLENGSYVTDYNLDSNSSTDTISSNVLGSIAESGSLSEMIKRSPSDKIKIYKEFKENIYGIYTMIFKDLDSLFYGLVL